MRVKIERVIVFTIDTDFRQFRNQLIRLIAVSENVEDRAARYAISFLKELVESISGEE